MEFKDFLLKDLFVADKGDVDLQQKDVNGKGHYLINSGVDNFGIKGRTDRPAKVFPANTITIDFWGNAYYRDFEYKMATHNHVFSLSGDIIKNREVGLFLVGSMASFPKVFSYSNMATWPKLKEMTVSLPVREDGTPDCDYMQECVIKTMQGYVKEVDAYLSATGLNDCELTEADKQVLELKPTWKDFKIVDIFDVYNTKSILKEQIVLNSGNIPYVTAGEADNAVMTYVDCPKEWIDKGNCVFIGGKTMVVTYQKDDFCSNDSHNLALYLKGTNVKECVYFYLVTSVKKSLGHKYVWGDSISRKKIQGDSFKLPVDENDQPDWDYMERYICAMEKRAIAAVVKWKDRMVGEGLKGCQ